MAHQLGPGQLTLGNIGSPVEWGAQLTKMELIPDTKTDDPTPLVDGSEAPGDSTTTWTLSGEFLEDYSATGIIQWCFDNKDSSLPFTFIPNSGQALKAAGNIKVTPVGMGGEAKKTSKRTFEFSAFNVDVSSAGV